MTVGSGSWGVPIGGPGAGTDLLFLRMYVLARTIRDRDQPITVAPSPNRRKVPATRSHTKNDHCLHHRRVPPHGFGRAVPDVSTATVAGHQSSRRVVCHPEYGIGETFATDFKRSDLFPSAPSPSKTRGSASSCGRVPTGSCRQSCPVRWDSATSPPIRRWEQRPVGAHRPPLSNGHGKASPCHRVGRRWTSRWRCRTWPIDCCCSC